MSEKDSAAGDVTGRAVWEKLKEREGEVVSISSSRARRFRLKFTSSEKHPSSVCSFVGVGVVWAPSVFADRPPNVCTLVRFQRFECFDRSALKKVAKEFL